MDLLLYRFDGDADGPVEHRDFVSSSVSVITLALQSTASTRLDNVTMISKICTCSHDLRRSAYPYMHEYTVADDNRHLAAAVYTRPHTHTQGHLHAYSWACPLCPGTTLRDRTLARGRRGGELQPVATRTPGTVLSIQSSVPPATPQPQPRRRTHGAQCMTQRVGRGLVWQRGRGPHAPCCAQLQ